MPITLSGSVAQTEGLSSNSAGAVRQSTDERRESNAGWIGLLVVWIFGVSVVLLLCIGGAMLFRFTATSADEYTKFITGSLDPYLKECATTLGTIFGSTLGFVLGYYFKTAASSPVK